MTQPADNPAHQNEPEMAQELGSKKGEFYRVMAEAVDTAFGRAPNSTIAPPIPPPPSPTPRAEDTKRSGSSKGFI